MRIMNDVIDDGYVIINNQKIELSDLMNTTIINNLFIGQNQMIQDYFRKLFEYITYLHNQQMECCKKLISSHMHCGCYSCNPKSIPGQAMDIKQLEAPIRVKELQASINKSLDAQVSRERAQAVIQKAQFIEPTKIGRSDDILPTFYGFPGDWFIQSDKVVNKAGEDLGRYMPWKINTLVEPTLVLECINSYRVQPNSYAKRPDILFTFQTYNKKTTIRRIFEANAFLFKKYYEPNRRV